MTRARCAMRGGRAGLLLLATLAVAGCGSAPRAQVDVMSPGAPVRATPPDAPVRAMAPGAPAGTPQWWTVQVRMGYRGAAEVQWHLDALLADRVFGPVVDRYRPALVLWRFHRRAAPDDVGHRLRFLFYADPAVARRVLAAVESSALLARLRENGDVEQVLLPQAGEDGIEATSDPGWPPEVQRSWPWFAMGVSENWLALIREVDAGLDAAPAPADAGALLERYADVNARVNELWRQAGRHAWLHHLNALFGYQPLLFEERRLIRF